MRQCPSCHTVYAASRLRVCPKDGDTLVELADGDPFINQTVVGRYRILSKLGAGGMGTVYRALQEGLERDVALKILRRELASDDSTVARFYQEARSTSLLSHPNTVRVYDFGADPATGCLFLAMELLEGELLTVKLQREQQIPVRESIAIAQGMLRSLAEAHSKGLVHRDLKPDNVFLSRLDGVSDGLPYLVKVLDFGIAKAFRPDLAVNQLETQAGTVFGTPRYMSPEQAQGKALDPRSDLYTLALLLYQMIGGRPPFIDRDAVVVMARHIREQPVSLRSMAQNQPVPASLDEVINRALAKEPADRFASADDFYRALNDCLPDIAGEEEERHRHAALSTEGNRIVANSVSPTPATPVRRNSSTARWAGIAAFVALIALGGTALAYFRAEIFGSEERERQAIENNGSTPEARAPELVDPAENFQNENTVGAVESADAGIGDVGGNDAAIGDTATGDTATRASVVFDARIDVGVGDDAQGASSSPALRGRANGRHPREQNTRPSNANENINTPAEQNPPSRPPANQPYQVWR